MFNRIVNVQRFTVVYHMDNMKLSYLDEKEVTNRIKQLEGIYTGMRVNHGKKYDYIRMDLDFRKEGKVMVSMVDYLKQTVDVFTESIKGIPEIPVTDHLFEVWHDCVKL